MPARPLPNNPSLEHVRKDARRLRNAVLAGDADALVQEFHPRANQAISGFALADAYMVRISMRGTRTARRSSIERSRAAGPTSPIRFGSRAPGAVRLPDTVTRHDIQRRTRRTRRTNRSSLRIPRVLLDRRGRWPQSARPARRGSGHRCHCDRRGFTSVHAQSGRFRRPLEHT
jgi:hypothetical protein